MLLLEQSGGHMGAPGILLEHPGLGNIFVALYSSGSFEALSSTFGALRGTFGSLLGILKYLYSSHLFI